jgi:hypothetical protein
MGSGFASRHAAASVTHDGTAILSRPFDAFILTSVCQLHSHPYKVFVMNILRGFRQVVVAKLLILDIL